jgi:hypothetical protein
MPATALASAVRVHRPRACRPMVATMAKMLAAFVGGGLSIATGSGFAGLAQRTDVTALAAWMLLTAADLRATTVGSGPR